MILLEKHKTTALIKYAWSDTFDSPLYITFVDQDGTNLNKLKITTRS
jgi:hypothetical protein